MALILGMFPLMGIALFYMMYLSMAILIVILQTTIIATISVSSSAFGSFLLPKYLKDFIGIVGNDKEKISILQNSYSKNIKDINFSNLLFSLGILAVIALAVMLIQSDTTRVQGFFLLPVIMILSGIDIVKKIKNKSGGFGKGERKFFVNLIYDIYKKDNDLARGLRDSFVLNSMLASTIASLKMNRYSIYSANTLPPSKDDQIDFAYYSLVSNYDNGIEIVNAIIKKFKT